MAGWIGVDLDRTLAHYDKWLGETHIGAPIIPMVQRIKVWLAEGRIVKIFTARVSSRDEFEVRAVTTAIQDWLEKLGLPRLEVTCVKDYQADEIYDDRAVTVEANTGRILGKTSRGLSTPDVVHMDRADLLVLQSICDGTWADADILSAGRQVLQKYTQGA